MTEQQIIQAINAQLGISQLNAMQIAVKDSADRKLILLAPTGSGKTVAFAIPMLRSMSKPDGSVRSLIIAPSRELVLQIYDIIRRIAIGFKTVVLYGGHAVADEVNSLSITPDIIVATPGRLLDHIQHQRVDLTGVDFLVLDEYDKSLELGFQEEMRRIVSKIKHLSSAILTSATHLTDMPAFADMRTARVIDFTAADDSRAAAPRLHIAHVVSPERDKLDTLVGLLRSLDNGQVIVFVNHRESAERVAQHLKGLKMPVSLYHGGLEQLDRERALLTFTNGSFPILVSTDLGARGLDINGVQAIIHYHLPPSAESWTHRNGRTGRQGADGDVYVITSEGENIPAYVNWQHDYTPSGESVCPITSTRATLYFNAGKREKISRGDIAGFLIQKGGLTRDEVGRIDISDHSAYAAVPRDKARETVLAVAPFKIKNQRVKVTQLK
jgi:superfamily II DNA/RNA helicase